MSFQNEKVVENKICKHCESNFEITDKDMEFYNKVSPVFNGEKSQIPTPTLCPDCRQQRRLSFRNENKLYKNKCTITGQDVISIYSPNKDYIVYNVEYWWADLWEAMDYGIEFDFRQSFFEQFGKLWKSVPVPNRTSNEPTIYNSDYCNEVGGVKNSYLCFESGQIENCLYSRGLVHCEGCIDCLNIIHSSGSYNCIESEKLNNCSHTYNSTNCYNTHFCSDCIGSKNCFLSTNLSNKEYIFKNKSFSKEDYFTTVSKYIKNTNNTQLLEDFNQLLKSKINIQFYNINNENSTGEYIINSKNLVKCFSCGDCEDCKYCDGLLSGGKNTDCMDVTNFGMGLSKSYESQCIGGNPGATSLTIFSNLCWPVDNIIYCHYCVLNTKNCFGCIGLKNKQYCIFNKQYTKEQYNILVPKIINHMTEIGEWGEFFPSNISPFGYNETVAQEYFPLNKQKAKENNFNWSDYESPLLKVKKIIPAHKLPDSITDIPDDILNWAVECEITNKPFIIIQQELNFYRKHNLPIPKRHPEQRHLDRMKLRNPRKLFTRTCDKCSLKIDTTYAPGGEKIVYCTECYNKEVY